MALTKTYLCNISNTLITNGELILFVYMFVLAVGKINLCNFDIEGIMSVRLLKVAVVAIAITVYQKPPPTIVILRCLRDRF